MLSPEKANTEETTDWKKQYAQTLKELDVKEKEWERQHQELLKTVLKLSFAFQGSNDILDKKLLDLKEALKQTDNKFPQKEIDQLAQAILKHKKDGICGVYYQLRIIIHKSCYLRVVLNFAAHVM